jgi:hypothetical protein
MTGVPGTGVQPVTLRGERLRLADREREQEQSREGE